MAVEGDSVADVGEEASRVEERVCVGWWGFTSLCAPT